MEACNVDAEWIDIHRDPARLEEIGASHEFVRERLHVVDDSGAVRVGAEAIGALWSQTPRLRFLAALLRMPVIRAVARWAYNVFAAGLYRWNRWRGPVVAHHDENGGRDRFGSAAVIVNPGHQP